MPIRITSALLCILLGVAGQASAQPAAQNYQSDVAAYEHFFLHVICILAQHGFVGSPSDYSSSSTGGSGRPAYGPGGRIAESHNRGLRTEKRPVPDDGRSSEIGSSFQSIERGQVSEELAKRITNLDAEHDQMVSDEIKRLKDAFGSERFEVFHSVVTAKKSR